MRYHPATPQPPSELPVNRAAHAYLVFVARDGFSCHTNSATLEPGADLASLADPQLQERELLHIAGARHSGPQKLIIR